MNLTVPPRPVVRDLCHEFPLRHNYTAQVVIPRDMTKGEADRLCAFLLTLAAPAASGNSTDAPAK